MALLGSAFATVISYQLYNTTHNAFDIVLLIINVVGVVLNITSAVDESIKYLEKHANTTEAES